MQKNAFHTLSYGVYAVTTMDGERPVGCIANSAMQITSQPPTLAISINQQNYTHDIIQKTGKLAVCVLPEQTDLSVIGTFGFQSSREVEKFAEIAYDQKDGLPVLKQCCAWFTLEVVQQMNAGTHTVFLRLYYCPAANDIRILSQCSQNEKPESCSNLCGRISGNSREKNPSLWKHRGGFFWYGNPLQTSDFMPKMLVHADFCRNQLHLQRNCFPIQ